MQTIKLSEATAARRHIPFEMVSSTDGLSEQAGLSFSGAEIQVLKNGGSWTNHAGSVVDKGSGSYDYVPTAGEVDTAGPLRLRVNKTGSRVFKALVMVQAFDPYDAAGLGLSRLDQAVSTRATPADVLAQAAAADVQTIRAGTLQGGSTTTATLDSGASSETDAYKDCALVVTHGSGLKETRLITAYNGTSKVATLEADRPLKTTAANTEAFAVVAGAPASLAGIPDVNLAEIGNSATRASRFGEGNDLTPTVVVSTATTTPTASLFRVTGMPSLGDASNLNGRAFHCLTGVNNMARRWIKALTVIGGGEVEIEVHPAFPNAPAGDDTYQVR